MGEFIKDARRIMAIMGIVLAVIAIIFTIYRENVAPSPGEYFRIDLVTQPYVIVEEPIYYGEPFLYEVALQTAPELVVGQPAYVVVFISGEVYQPAVAQLARGSRIIDAVEYAGGTTQYADYNRINLARVLEDGEHIIVPTIGEELPVSYSNISTGQGQAQSSALININTADATALQTLPGIGPVISQNIIDHREQHGNFTTIEQIQNVGRIGPTIFNNIRDMITVN